MGIFYADPAFLESLEGLDSAKYIEIMKILEQVESKIDLEMQAYEFSQLKEVAEYEVLENPIGRVHLDVGTRMSGPYNPPANFVSQTSTALEVANEAYDAAVLDKWGNVVYKYSNSRGAMSTSVGATTAKTVPLLSLDVGVVGAAVAPVLGIGLGYGLYKSNPAFWTKLSQKLLPFCYPGSTNIPGWLDIIETGLGLETHAVIDKRIVDTIKEFFDEEGIKPDVRKSSIPYVGSVEYSNYFTYKMY